MIPTVLTCAAGCACLVGLGLALASCKYASLRESIWLPALAVAALLLQTASLGLHCSHATSHLFASVAENLWLVAWSANLALVLGLVFFRVGMLGALLFPLVTLLLFGSLLLGAPHAQVGARLTASKTLLAVHIMCAFLGYGLFIAACAASALYLQQDRLLKRKLFDGWFQALPSLGRLQGAADGLVWIGFGLFSVALGTGIVLAKAEFPAWLLEPKMLAAVATWVVFLALGVGRLSGRLGGREAARVVLLGAAMVLVTLALSHPFHEGRYTPPDEPSPHTSGDTP